MKISRREVLQFVGGSALGVLLSPIPWKVLDDTAIWTQNWPWTPKPTRGDITYRLTSCTLCPASCGMRSRTVGIQPVSIAGTPHHPFNNGALCTTGILAHHLRYHPARLKTAVKIAPNTASGSPMAPTDALAEASALAKRSASVVIADHRPGRAVSGLFRALAASRAGMRYVPVQPNPIEALALLSGTAEVEAGYDMENARLILSFGAPVFDGWGSPSRTASYLDKRGRQTLIQIEPARSRTAQLASEWIASRPGSEAAAALSMAFVILDEKRASSAALNAITDINEFTSFVSAFAPEQAEKTTGIAPRLLRETARRFMQEGPSFAIASSDASVEARAAVMLLNILAGSIGTEGGVALRTAVPSAQPAATLPPSVTLDAVVDHSVNVFILDESLSGSTIPDAVLEKKLAPQGVILSLSPFVTPRPFALQYVIPSTVIFETMSDVPGPFDAPRASLALSSVLLPAPEGTMDAVQFAHKAAETLGVALVQPSSAEELLKARIAALHASKRGSVFNAASGEMQALTLIASADDLWSTLAEGGCWIDAPSSARPARAAYRAMPLVKDAALVLRQDAQSLIVYPLASNAAYTGTAVSPLMSKLTQESGLRLSSAQASINPSTADANHITHGETIALRTKNGSMHVQARLDASVMPDVVFVSCPPDACGASRQPVQQPTDVRTICEVSTSGSYSPTPVTIQKVYL